MPAKSKHSHKSGSLHKSATPAANKSRSTAGASRTSASRLHSRRRSRSPLGLILVLVLMAVVAVVYFATRSPAGEATTPAAEITAAQAYEKYQAGVFFLDVREQDEWDAGHIPNTTHIPLGELASRVNELPTDQEIVVVCRSGNRSVEGRDFLLDNGFTNVSSMAGGVRDWGNAGYPFEGAIP